ncbi:MAG: hypothetical protein FWF59_04945 [Turicibacter sp.]|nr:hypothetical protein [Turicibacter sp.]
MMKVKAIMYRDIPVVDSLGNVLDDKLAPIWFRLGKSVEVWLERRNGRLYPYQCPPGF